MTTIVCLALKDHSTPDTESVYRKCDICGQLIWLALNSPHADHLICVACFNETDNMDKLNPANRQAIENYNRREK